MCQWQQKNLKISMNVKGIMNIISLWVFENISLHALGNLEIRTLIRFLLRPSFPRLKNACVLYTPQAECMQEVSVTVHACYHLPECSQ